VVITKLNKKGMTLVEVMVAVMILTIGIFASLLCFTRSNEATLAARDLTTAVTHAEYILEEMHTLAALTDITSTNWSTWANAQGLNTLDNESISVIYLNPLADPLSVMVTINWETKGRNESTFLATEFTK